MTGWDLLLYLLLGLAVALSQGYWDWVERGRAEVERVMARIPRQGRGQAS